MNRFVIDIQLDDGLQNNLEFVSLDAARLELQLETAAIQTLRQQEIVPPHSLTVLITDDAYLQRLNRDYRGYDEVTDVLSFEDGSEMPGVGRYLGDIAISLPQAARQATQRQHPLLSELILLTVHGTLHLIGHDHADDQEKAIMWQAQDTVLAQLDLAIRSPI